LDRVGASDAIFDPGKLRWLSATHTERMSPEDLAQAGRPTPPQHLPCDEAMPPEATRAGRPHRRVLPEGPAQAASMLPPGAVPALGPDALPVLHAARDVLSAADWSADALSAALKDVAKRANAKGRGLYEPLRLALTGAPHGPPLVAVLRVQGQQEVLRGL